MSPIRNQSNLTLQQHNECIKDYFLTEFHKNKWEKDVANNHFKLRRLDVEDEFGSDDFYNTQLCSDVWYEMICFLMDEGLYEDDENRNDEDYYFEYIYYFGINYINGLTLNEFAIKMNELTNLHNRIINHSKTRNNNIRQSIQ